jgi:autotransporter-associated beta strand protein
MNPGGLAGGALGMGVQASLTVTNTGQVYLGGGGLIAYGNTFTTNTVTLGDNAVLGARATWYDSYGTSAPIGINLVRGMPTIKAADAGGTVYNIDLSAALVGAGGLTKSGGGILTLWAAANTYSGETRIDEGTLAIAGTIDNTPTITIASGAALDLANSYAGGLTLQSGQTLKGNGTVQGGLVTVLSGSTVAPGESVGTLTVSGDLTLQGDLDVEVDRTAVAADVLAVSGTLDISSGMVTFNWSGDPDTNAYVFATYGALNGTFATVNNLPDGYYIDYNYQGASQMAVIPEPSTWMLAGFGLLGAYLVRRRTRK